MNGIAKLTLSLAVALCAVVSTNAFAQTCTDSSACTTSPAALCDGNTAVYYAPIGICTDTDSDGTLDACRYETVRTQCDGRCQSGQCIATNELDIEDADVCEGITLTQSTCNTNGDGGTLYWGIEGVSGSCVIQSETFSCTEGTSCVVNGQQSYCEDVGPSIVAAVRPGNVGHEDGLTWEEWNRVSGYYAVHAHLANQDRCYELNPDVGSMGRCQNFVEFLASSGDEDKTMVARRRLAMGR